MQIFFLITDCYQPMQHLIWEDIYLFMRKIFLQIADYPKLKIKAVKFLCDTTIRLSQFRPLKRFSKG